jgi:TonB family protein
MTTKPQRPPARTPLALAALALLAALPPGAAAAPLPAAEPTLATPPALKQLVPADLPAGTAFPAPSIDVYLGIDVAATGQVEAVRLEQGAGEPFDAAALAAARSFLFEPGRLTTGEPVPVSVTFKFTITAPPPSTPAEAARPAPVRFVGRLLERGTRRPLADAAVQVRTSGPPLRTTSGTDGRFALEIPEASFTLVAAPAGHDRLEVTVQAVPGEEREETYYLEGTGTGYETVIRAEPVRREITRQVIPAAEVARVPGSQGDTIKAVLNLPGAARVAFGGDVILRGSAPGDSRFFVEGQEIPLLYHFGGLRSTINPRFLESVEFVPGNFASDYGRATGGIIEVKLRDPASDMVRGDASFSLYDFGGSVEGPMGGGWSGGAAFHRSWIDTLLPLVIPKDANLSFDSAPRYYDYQFLASRKLGDQALRLLYYGSMDKVIVVLKHPGDDPKITGQIAARTMFHALQARLEGEVRPGLRQESSVQLTFTQFRTQFGPEFFFDLGALTAAVRSAWTLDVRPGLQLRAGIDSDVTSVNIDLNTPQPPKEGEVQTPVSTSPTSALKTTTSSAQPAVFVEARWEPVKGLAVLPGVRADYYTAIDRATVDPRLGVRWEAVPGTTLLAGVGLFQQPPQPDESAAGFGNPHLLAPRAVHWSAGAEQKVIDGLDADVTGFYKELSRLVVRNPASAYDPSAPVYLSEGVGRVYGLEATLKARFGDRFFGWVAYTHQRAFRTDHPGSVERRFDYDQPHILTVLGTWTFNPKYSLGARFRLVSGNPTTPVTGSVLDASSGTFVPTYGAVNTDRLPTFAQLDVRFDRTWTYKTWKLGLYLDVQNVSNRGNVEGYSYSYDYASRTPATGLPILPILGIQGEW